MMKKGLIGLAIVGFFFLSSCNPSKSADNKDAGAVLENTETQTSKAESTQGTVVYVSYNGTAVDDGSITGKDSKEEFHLFVKNSTANIVYVISSVNYGLWSSQKLMPAELKPGLQTYKMDIATSRKLANDDNTVEYHEVTKLNKMVETDEIDE